MKKLVLSMVFFVLLIVSGLFTINKLYTYSIVFITLTVLTFIYLLFWTGCRFGDQFFFYLFIVYVCCLSFVAVLFPRLSTNIVLYPIIHSSIRNA